VAPAPSFTLPALLAPQQLLATPFDVFQSNLSAQPSPTVAQMQQRYKQLPTPDKLVPDVFERLTGVPKKSVAAPKAKPLAPVQAKPLPPAPKPVAPPAPPKAAAEPPPPAVVKPKPASPAKPSTYLTPNMLSQWQQNLSSDEAAIRQQASRAVCLFLGQHSPQHLNPTERAALAALTLNALQDQDKWVRHWALVSLKLGRIHCTPAERGKVPYKPLHQQVKRLTKLNDPVLGIDAFERNTVTEILKNWSALTTLEAAAPTQVAKATALTALPAQESTP
jgi:hypothetical protein